MLSAVEYSGGSWVGFPVVADARRPEMSEDDVEFPGGSGIESHVEAFRGATRDPDDVEGGAPMPSGGSTDDRRRPENVVCGGSIVEFFFPLERKRGWVLFGED
uniref:Uncharacterized protein n=1 Tax=Opuntia streptacantha TaxID=393608 RepID=A0A7C9CGS0_OPUST